jgi:CSLREA domain-containing protein
MIRGRDKGLGFALAATAVLAAPGLAHAAVVTPTTTADEYTPTANAICSLREAVQSSNQNSNFGGCTNTGGAYGSDTVQLAAGRYVLTIPPAAPDDQATGDLNSSGDLKIQANPGAPVTIDGNGTDRVFVQGVSAQGLTLDGVTITGGFVSTPDPMTGFIGGGIFTSSDSPLTITNSTITGNSVDGAGGAIDANGPTSITNTTISGNTSTDSGGGGLFVSATTLALDHVTISDNHSLTTTPGVQAGGVYVNSGTAATAHNSVIAGNTSAASLPAPDCQGTINSQDGNVLGSNTGCTFNTQSGDDVNVAAGLSPLALRGGPTQTHGLLAGSVAIDNGQTCALVLDQRGYTRAGRGTTCDSGAFELGSNHTLTVTLPVNGTVTGNGISCPGDCTEIALDGTNIPLTPNPAAGFAFGSWSGDCTGGGSCAAILDADRAIGASFVVAPPAPTQPASNPAPTMPVPAKKCKKKKPKKSAQSAKKKCKRKQK